MASSNINKIVQSNINLKPWMLSKNTNEIVNSYVQKIYKQIPTNFRKDTRTVIMTTPKPENRGPISTLKNLERKLPVATITPRATTMKRTNSKTKQQQNNTLVKCLNINNNKLVAPNLTPSKRLLKTPNYKIYKSLRYGSSSCSSHSSLWKRYDDRKRSKQSTPRQFNYLMRSFHTSRLEPTYARYLMPARNQQVEADLGSIPDAVKFSSNIIKDLMTVDKFTRNKAPVLANNPKPMELPPDMWNRSFSLSKYHISNPKDSAIKHVKLHAERSVRKPKLSPEHRDYARINVSRVAQLRHPKPPNELFTAQHDRNNTELHEKHRRNRMQKLGLLAPSTVCAKEKTVEPVLKQRPKDVQNETELNQSVSHVKTAASKIANQAHNTILTDVPLNTKQIRETPPNTNSQSMSSATVPSEVPLERFAGIPKVYTTTSPIAAARAQMPSTSKTPSYRYNRSDFFSTRKY